MRFWNVDRVVHELAAGSISESQKLAYFIATQLMWTVGLLVPPENVDYLWVLETVLPTLIGVAGYIAAFRVNAATDGRAFIERATVIGFPLMIRVLVMATAAFLVIGAVGSAFVSGLEEKRFFFLTFGVGFSLAYACLLHRKFVLYRRLVTGRASESAEGSQRPDAA